MSVDSNLELRVPTSDEEREAINNANDAIADVTKDGLNIEEFEKKIDTAVDTNAHLRVQTDEVNDDYKNLNEEEDDDALLKELEELEKELESQTSTGGSNKKKSRKAKKAKKSRKARKANKSRKSNKSRKN